MNDHDADELEGEALYLERRAEARARVAAMLQRNKD